MESFPWEFAFFPAVGAIIGALTNQIAIKMLFRPYRTLYFLGLRLPFTPGVIPAQRHVIAENIASTFEEQLLSGAEIHAVITGERAHRVVQEKVQGMLAGLGPMAALAAPIRPMIVEKVLGGIEELATDLIQPGGELDVGRSIRDKIDVMDIAHLEQLVLGFSSRQFRHITFFGGVLGFLIGLIQAIASRLLLA
ncbi:MAG TPA: DUF445 family protein [Candidatus Krumholzibacteria bacterium]